MKALDGLTLNGRYTRIPQLGDTFAELESVIEWEAFRPIVKGLFGNSQGEMAGHGADEMLLLKMLVLQSFYGLSDEEVERQAIDRTSFRKFLGFPERVPDHITLRNFKECLVKSGKEKAVRNMLQDQLDAKGLKVRKGVLRDVTLTAAGPGQSTSGTSRGEVTRTQGIKDDTWVKKGR